MRVRVFYHDKCFDGACSASLFTRFHRECITRDASYEYHGLVHRAGALFDESEFTDDENAIVDFKYSASPRITWWFDHHQSAFLTPQDHENFLACQRDPQCAARKFFDPNYTSCTSFLAHIAKTRYGFDTAPVAELIHWADIVDGAKYESPEAAVEMAAPAMKLTLIIEATQDPEFIPRLIPLLTEMPLDKVLCQPFVSGLLPPLLERHREALELIRSRAEERDGTIFFDITDHPLEGFNKFIPYYLYPQATYSIGLSKSSFRTKVAVGSNPWTKADPEKLVNLAQICERYGGGGHARVGAISFPPDREVEARAAAKEIVAELRKTGTEGLRDRVPRGRLQNQQMSQYLFVYGTLQPGLAPTKIARVAAKLRPVGEGFVRGVLYDLGGYPGAVADPNAKGRIIGTVMELPEDEGVLERLDRYEGFDPQAPETSEYIREKQVAEVMTGGTVECWFYRYNRKPRDADQVESGEWGR